MHEQVRVLVVPEAGGAGPGPEGVPVGRLDAAQAGAGQLRLQAQPGAGGELAQHAVLEARGAHLCTFSGPLVECTNILGKSSILGNKFRARLARFELFLEKLTAKVCVFAPFRVLEHAPNPFP